MRATASLVVTLLLVMPVVAQRNSKSGWSMEFDAKPKELSATGRNPYFILEPGYVLSLADGKNLLVITVLNETRIVGGVETRVIQERETVNGEVVEVSRNYFAISTQTQSVFYFGEDVDIYKHGKVVSHEGSWLADKDGARFGMMMPGRPAVGARYYQEICPGVAMDRAEILSLADTRKTAAGTFLNVLKVAETTPLEPKSSEAKYYAPNVGLIQDGSYKLFQYGFPPGNGY